MIVLMKRIDLHTHTTASDGALSPRGLVALAAARNLGAVAITDHDTLDGLDEGETAAKGLGLAFVPGAELSALYNRKEIHIVGLFIDRRSEALRAEIGKCLEARRRRNAELLASLNAAGIDIDMAQVESFVPLALSGGEAAAITRSHFAGALVAGGYCRTRKKAFDRYLSPGTPTFVERPAALPAEDAISVIRRAGGLAVLAHPLRYRMDMPEVKNMAARLKEMGLDGIECYYPTHRPYECGQLLRMAKEYRLCVSGGSDFHGNDHGTPQLGSGRGRMFIPMTVYDRLVAALGGRGFI